MGLWCNFPPQSINYFDFSYLFKQPIGREEMEKLQKFLLLSRFFLFSHYSSSSNFDFAGNFCSSLLLLLLRCVSYVFYTCFLCFLWVIVDGSCSYHQECFIVMNPYLFFEEYQGLKLFRSICERIEQCRKQDTQNMHEFQIFWV